MKVVCFRCGKRVSVTDSRKVGGRYFSIGCYSKIVSRQNLRGRSQTSIERVCESCGRRYLASDEDEYICGSNRGRCCFCCEYSSSLRFRSVMCPFEAEKFKNVGGLFS